METFKHVAEEESAKEEKSSIPELAGDVFKSWVEGTARVPQQDFGMELYTIRALVEHPEQSWRDFAYSKMTDEQVAHLGKLMSRMHKHREIDLVTAEHADPDNPNEEVMRDQRLHELWYAVRDNVLRKLDAAIEEIDKLYGIPRENPRITLQMQYGFIESFMRAAPREHQVAMLREAVGAMVRAVESGEAAELLDKWRASMTGGSKRMSSMEMMQELRRIVRDHVLRERPDLDAQFVTELVEILG